MIYIANSVQVLKMSLSKQKFDLTHIELVKLLTKGFDSSVILSAQRFSVADNIKVLIHTFRNPVFIHLRELCRTSIVISSRHLLQPLVFEGLLMQNAILVLLQQRHVHQQISIKYCATQNMSSIQFSLLNSSLMNALF